MYNFSLANSYRDFSLLISKNINPDVLEKYRVKFFSVSFVDGTMKRKAKKCVSLFRFDPSTEQPTNVLQIFFQLDRDSTLNRSWVALVFFRGESSISERTSSCPVLFIFR